MRKSELVICDSSGSGLQDVAAAWLAYREGLSIRHRRVIRFVGSHNGTVKMAEEADAPRPRGSEASKTEGFL